MLCWHCKYSGFSAMNGGIRAKLPETAVDFRANSSLARVFA
jgi:hypothetical protein